MRILHWRIFFLVTGWPPRSETPFTISVFFESDSHDGGAPDGPDGPDGPDPDGDNFDDNCPEIDLGTEENLIYFEPGVSPVSVNIASAFQQLGIDLSDAYLDIQISSEIGGPYGSYDVDSQGNFNVEVPDGEYFIQVDLDYTSHSTAECVGQIIFDIASTGTVIDFEPDGPDGGGFDTGGPGDGGGNNDCSFSFNPNVDGLGAGANPSFGVIDLVLSPGEFWTNPDQSYVNNPNNVELEFKIIEYLPEEGFSIPPSIDSEGNIKCTS